MRQTTIHAGFGSSVNTSWRWGRILSGGCNAGCGCWRERRSLGVSAPRCGQHPGGACGSPGGSVTAPLSHHHLHAWKRGAGAGQEGRARGPPALEAVWSSEPGLGGRLERSEREGERGESRGRSRVSGEAGAPDRGAEKEDGGPVAREPPAFRFASSSRGDAGSSARWYPRAPAGPGVQPLPPAPE